MSGNSWSKIIKRAGRGVAVIIATVGILIAIPSLLGGGLENITHVQVVQARTTIQVTAPTAGTTYNIGDTISYTFRFIDRRAVDNIQEGKVALICGGASNGLVLQEWTDFPDADTYTNNWVVLRSAPNSTNCRIGVNFLIDPELFETNYVIPGGCSDYGSCNTTFVESAAFTIVNPDTTRQDTSNLQTANTTPGKGDGWLAGLIKNGAYSLVDLFGRLTLAVFNWLVAVTQYNGFTTEPIVTTGWKLVRDISNMFFIFALLLIAFGTILRIQAYHYRSLLFKVLLMATLLNLSKAITGFLIDLSQIVMLTFVSAFRGMVGSNLAQALGMDKLLNLSAASSANDTGATAGGFVTAPTGADVATIGSTVAAYVVAAICMFLIFVVILSIFITFLIRILKLWVLTILSPIAFAASAFKNFASYSTQWWSTLTKELINGPVLAFFLWLVLAIAKSPITLGIENSADPNYNPTNLTGFTSVNFINFTVIMGLLLTALGVAKASGVAGAGVAGWGIARLQGAGRGIQRLGTKGVKWTGKQAGRGAKAVGGAAVAGAGVGLGMAYSKSGLKGKVAVMGAGLKATTAGKAVAYFGKEQRLARKQKREAIWEGRVQKQYKAAEEAGALAGQDVGALQRARQQRAAKQRMVANVAVNQKLKDLDEKGVSDNQSIRTALAANKNAQGKVKDEVLQQALLRQLVTKGKVVDANKDIIDNTAGMHNADDVRTMMKAAFKDFDTSAIKIDGSIAEGEDLKTQMDDALKGDSDRGAKGKRFKGIAAQARVDENGNPVNSTAQARLLSSSFDNDYYTKLDGSIKKDIDEAFALSIANAAKSGDTATMNKLIDKHKEVTGGFTADKDKKVVDYDPTTGVAVDSTLRKNQFKAVNKQEDDQIKNIRLKRDNNIPLDEAEKSWERLLAVMDDAPEKIDELRAKLIEFSTLDPVNNPHDRAESVRLTTDIAGLKDDIESMAKKETSVGGKLAGMAFKDKNGKDVSSEKFVENMMGGDMLSKIADTTAAVSSGDLSVDDAQKRIKSMQGGVAARVNRVYKPSTFEGPGKPPVAKEAQAFGTKYIPTQPRYQQSRTAVNNLVKSDVGALQGGISNAFKQTELNLRMSQLGPVLDKTTRLINKMLNIDNLDPLLKVELQAMWVELQKINSKGSDASEAEVQNLLGRFNKLQNLT